MYSFIPVSLNEKWTCRYIIRLMLYIFHLCYIGRYAIGNANGVGSCPALGGHCTLLDHNFYGEIIFLWRDTKNWGATSPPCPLVPTPMAAMHVLYVCKCLWISNFSFNLHESYSPTKVSCYVYDNYRCDWSA